jgi:polar amino acid transport system substrate-binding protein
MSIPSPSLRRWLAALALAAFGGAALAQTFDSSPEQKGRPRTERNAAAIAAIPKDYKFVREGVLTVAIAPFAPPISTYATDAKTVVGFDPDYALLIADALGLKLELVPIAWADWPLGLSSGKYDAVISNVGVAEQRKEKFDFSTYRLGLHGFYVRADSKIASIKEPKDVAGLKVITASGTNQERILLEWNREEHRSGPQARGAGLLRRRCRAPAGRGLGPGRCQLQPQRPPGLPRGQGRQDQARGYGECGLAAQV